MRSCSKSWTRAWIWRRGLSRQKGVPGERALRECHRDVSRHARGGGRDPALSKTEGFPESLTLAFDKVEDLRYGENPHQSAAFYRDAGSEPATGVAGAEQLHGKELSYNNILDLDAGWRLARKLPGERAAAVVIKHTNPCGAALGESPSDHP